MKQKFFSFFCTFPKSDIFIVLSLILFFFPVFDNLDNNVEVGAQAHSPSTQCFCVFFVPDKQY